MFLCVATISIGLTWYVFHCAVKKQAPHDTTEFDEGWELGILDHKRNIDPRFCDPNHSGFAAGYYGGYCYSINQFGKTYHE